MKAVPKHPMPTLEETIMPPLSLEERVATLEQQIAQLQVDQRNTEKKDWRDAAGIFTDNPGMLEIFEEAKKIREADRAKARRRAQKSRRKES